MILPVLYQGGLFLGAIVAGFVLAFFYDLFRVIRRIIPHSGAFILLEDIAYWIIVVLIMFYFILRSNNGEIRLFSIAGAFIGMYAYFTLLSSMFLGLSLTIYNALKISVLFLISIILAPFKALIYLLSFPASYVSNKAKAVYDYEKKVYKKMKIRSRKKARMLKNDIRIIFRKI